jgi:hypothetical protein
MNKEKVVENIRIKASFDVEHGSTSYYYYIESLLDSSILHVGNGNANYEMNEDEMDKDIRNLGREFVETSRYKKHVMKHVNIGIIVGDENQGEA